MAGTPSVYRRSVSRHSNLPESYVHCHSRSSVHPVSLPDRPRFVTSPHRSNSLFASYTRSPSPPSPLQQSLSPASTVALPATSSGRSAQVDPTANAPLSSSSVVLQRAALGPVSWADLNAVAGLQQEADEMRLLEQEAELRRFKRSVQARLRQHSSRRREQERARKQQLPDHVQRLLYDAQPTQQTADRPADRLTVDQLEDTEDEEKAEQREADTEHQRWTRAGDAGGAAVAKSSSLELSRHEQQLYHLRILQLAGYRERREALRLKEQQSRKAEQLQRQLQRRQQQETASQPLSERSTPPDSPPPPPPPPPPQPHPRPHLRPSSSRTQQTLRRPPPAPSVSAPVSPLAGSSSSSNSASRGDMTRWLSEELQRRLKQLADVGIAPLCRCSEGGGEAGTQLRHREGCQWRGREEEYLYAMIAACMQLQRAQDDQDMQQGLNQLQIKEGNGQRRSSRAAAADRQTRRVS